MITITATAATNHSRKAKASASERSGFGGCLRTRAPGSNSEAHST
jgi:hypothetical protein